MKNKIRRLSRSRGPRRLLLVAGFSGLLLFGVQHVFEDSLQEAMALPTLVQLNHPLEYDESLGMYGHSDHVGMHYPFSTEALAQPVASPAVAAGLQQPEESVFLPGELETVHHADGVQDANADMTADLEGNLWIVYTSFRDQDEDIYIRRRRPDGSWEQEKSLSNHPGADFNPTIEAEQDGKVWVVWSRQKGGAEWPLMARRFDGENWSEERELASGKHYLPVLERNAKTGELWLAYEDWSDGESRVRTMSWDGRKWSRPYGLPSGVNPEQRPALASGPDGAMWLAYDIAKNRKYDVRLAKWKKGGWKVQPAPPPIEGHRRSTALDVDREGRAWLLPETLVIEPIQVRQAFYGQEVIYNVRPPSRAALVWTGKEWKALLRGPVTSAKAPTLYIDRDGTVWFLTRTVSPAVKDFIGIGQRYRGNRWFGQTFEEGPWTAQGDYDPDFVLGGAIIASPKEPLAVVETKEGLYFAWHRTYRKFTWDPAWTYADGAVGTVLYKTKFESQGYRAPQVVDFDPTYHGTASLEVEKLPHPEMVRAAAKGTFGGKEMKIYYGDLHHHTELSRDPGYLNDDVESNYRYVRDIRQLDFLGLADHVEHLNENDWYHVRRAAAFFNNGEQFSTFAAFEWTSEFYRGGNYQEGHHNVVHRTDGPEVRYYSASLPQSNTPLRLTERLEADISRAQRQNINANTFLFPHDPSRSVQPITWSWYNPRIRLLELVQSRGAHEHLGGPQKTPLRNDIQQLLGKSAQDGLKRGFRWGFAGSGDHFGRPVAGVFAPAGNREVLFDSLYAKQAFATTGARMVVNLSVNGHPMGSEWKGKDTEHTVDVYARGTRLITLIELWKNGRMLHRWSPQNGRDGKRAFGKEFRQSFKDPSAPYLRENWWYLRVIQEDGEIAWSSPVWFVYEGIDPVVVADAGRRQPNYIMPQFPVPIPILMRNQKEETVRGRLKLANVPEGWRLDPDGEIRFELPPESWTTYVWYVKASPESIKEMSMVPIELQVEYESGTEEKVPLVVVQVPKLLNTRGQLSEISDALHLQEDHGVLNRWLKTMAEKWGISKSPDRKEH